MDGASNENEPLRARIQQLEHERDELHKDIEQLCMQQAGPGYLSVATKMHFQRTAALEQEIEGLKKRLAACTRENQNLQEELSEAYRIKGQLADLHAAEISKNADAEKQLKFFQSCVATAFAERDHSIMEAEKAKEKEELMAQKFNEFQKRLQDLTSDCLEQKKLNDALHVDLAKQEELNNPFKKVIDKFFEIRKLSLEEVEDASWDDKCELLLHDPAETWSFNDTSTAKYISALEDELEKMRSSVDNLQSKLRLGLEIENHLKKAVRESEKKIIRLSKHINCGIVELRHCHSQHRVYIMNLLDDERSNMKCVANMIEEKIQQFDMRREHDLEAHQREEKVDEFECRDVHISTDASCSLVSERNPELSDSLADRKSSISEALSLALQEKMNEPELSDSIAYRKGDMSEALAQALQEKVAALLLLSQQEERHLLERNVNAALQKKIEELQRNLLQVTNEKVKALMELAQLKQEYQQLQEKLGNEITQGKSSAEIGDRGLVNPEGDGRLKNLLKKTNIRRWVGTLDFSGIGTQVLNNEGDATSRKSSGMDFARLRIENATLKESIENMEHLTSSIHRLRLSVAKARDSVVSKDTVSSRCKALGDIIHEANLLKTAFGSSLPVSWSAESDVGSAGGSAVIEPDETYGSEKMDAVCAAGLEMVELLILAAQILKDWTPKLDMD